MKIKKSLLLNMISQNLGNQHYISESRGIQFNSQASTFEMCDLGDIEWTAGYKELKKYLDDNNQKTLSKEIEKLSSDIDNAASTVTDPQYDAMINTLESKKRELEDLQKGYFGMLSGVFTKTFQNNLTTLANFGMLGALGPTSVLYCSVLKSVVNVLNSALGAYTDRPETEEEVKDPSLDNIYRLLDRISSLVLGKLDLEPLQNSIWSKVVERKTRGFSEREKTLFKFIYVRTAAALPSSYPSTASSSDLKAEFQEDQAKNWDHRMYAYIPSSSVTGIGSPTPPKEMFKKSIDFVDNREEFGEFVKEFMKKVELVPLPTTSGSGPRWHAIETPQLSSRDIKDVTLEIVNNFKDKKDVQKMITNFKANLSAIP